jgi:putative DNA methylase
LVQWENTHKEDVLERARAEIRRSWRETCELNKSHPQAAELFNPEKLPGFHDPFAGGGSIPLEAQRLGLDSYASDLNPVAVTVNKAMIEMPPRFAGRAPVGPRLVKDRQEDHAKDWSGARGLAEDVRRYGAWMRAEAEKRIGHLYPKITITTEMAAERPDLKPMVGQSLTVIAWLWARTVKSPNPAFSHVEVPLASNFVLSSKEGKQSYVEPLVEGGGYRFTVKSGTPPAEALQGTAAGKRGGFYCLLSRSPIDYKYIRAEGTAGRMGARLMAIVAQGARGRFYLTPTREHEAIALDAKPEWRPEVKLHGKCRVNVSNYGLDTYGDLFTARQLVALSTFSDLLQEAVGRCRQDAVAGGMADDGLGLDAGGSGASAYAEALAVFLSFVQNKTADGSSTVCRWMHQRDSLFNTFAKQALPMNWDYAEVNVLADCTRSFSESTAWTAESIEGTCVRTPAAVGVVELADAQKQEISAGKVVSTDPPYYDNIGYADLSDFFYVWLRKSLKPIYPGLYATLAVPKSEELVATPYRHGSNEEAEAFFLSGMTQAMHNLAVQAHPAFPVTIYYAFKQSETKGEAGTSSTGWETFLEAVIRAGFGLTGTWPMRTERDTRSIGLGTNALASSIILVCRKRATDAATVSRREFIRELNAALPDALDEMTRGGVNSPVAPVDLSQAIIGPGMAIFSQYAAVFEADGTPMSVKTALQLINRFLAEDDFDHDTQFCLHWFEQHGWGEGQVRRG